VGGPERTNQGGTIFGHARMLRGNASNLEVAFLPPAGDPKDPPSRRGSTPVDNAHPAR
jgi:hypothetical protein